MTLDILNKFMRDREKMLDRIQDDPHVQDSTKPRAILKLIDTKVGR
jgi:hypothetical protein